MAGTSSAPAASSAALNAAPSVAASSAAGAPPGNDVPEPLLTGIARLKAEQARLRSEKKRVQKELKNAEKRRVRLRKRARQLSDADLVAVLQMRDSASTAGPSEASEPLFVAGSSTPAEATAAASSGA